MPLLQFYLMNKLVIVGVFIFLSLNKQVNGQSHDYMWPLGYGPNNSEHRIFYNFKDDPPSTIIRSDSVSNGLYSASFCDQNGNIQFFSNGLKIFDKNGIIVENGFGLNPTVVEWQSRLSYPGGQSGFFLGRPGNSDLIYLLSLDFGLHPANEWPYEYVGQNLLVATIDATANDGHGRVVQKNEVLLSGTLMAPTACIHANGRDWWILVSDADSNRHFRILLESTGFSAPAEQLIGSKPNPIPYNNGNQKGTLFGNCFSPSGQLYADINDYLGISIFHFDRCSGLLFNERRIDFSPSPYHSNFYRNGPGFGAAFSADDHFFYKTATLNGAWVPLIPAGTIPYLFQYDLQNININESVDTINIIDSIDYHFPGNITWEGFYGMELGPDGRLYVAHTDYSYCTVQYPNEPGKKSKFKHDTPFFGTYKSVAIPYMPNYRLGPLDGSPCDTLGINNIPVANFRIDDSLGLLSRYFYDLSHHEPATWNWDFGDGFNSTEQSPLHQYENEGIYQVCLTVSNPYGSDTHCRTLSLGISKTETPQMMNQVEISPNPFCDKLSVVLNANLHSPVFWLYDQMGRLFYQQHLAFGNTEIETRTFPPGIYFWEVRIMGELAKSGKVIKVEN